LELIELFLIVTVLLPLCLALDLIFVTVGFTLTVFLLVIGSWGEIALVIFAWIKSSETGDSLYQFSFILLLVPATWMIVACCKKRMDLIHTFFIPHYRVGLLRVVINHFMGLTIQIFN
jgi:hypothetical protein